MGGPGPDNGHLTQLSRSQAEHAGEQSSLLPAFPLQLVHPSQASIISSPDQTHRQVGRPRRSRSHAGTLLTFPAAWHWPCLRSKRRGPPPGRYGVDAYSHLPQGDDFAYDIWLAGPGGRFVHPYYAAAGHDDRHITRQRVTMIAGPLDFAAVGSTVRADLGGRVCQGFCVPVPFGHRVSAGDRAVRAAADPW